jgi:hypothetical protein
MFHLKAFFQNCCQKIDLKIKKNIRCCSYSEKNVKMLLANINRVVFKIKYTYVLRKPVRLAKWMSLIFYNFNHA